MTTATTPPAADPQPAADHGTISKDLSKVATQIEATQRKLDDLLAQRRVKVGQAFAAGMKVGPIADAARISKARAYQDRDGRR